MKTPMLVLMLLCVLEIIPRETSPEPFASARALVWNPTSEVEHSFEKMKVVRLQLYDYKFLQYALSLSLDHWRLL